jgi:hypothetical protein
MIAHLRHKACVNHLPLDNKAVSLVRRRRRHQPGDAPCSSCQRARRDRQCHCPFVCLCRPTPKLTMFEHCSCKVQPLRRKSPPQPL